MTAEMRPSLKRSATARPRERGGGGEARAGGFADVDELDEGAFGGLDGAWVAVEEAGLAVEGAELGGVDLGVDVAVRDEDVGVAVVVGVEEGGAPAEGVGVDAEAGGEGDVGEGRVRVGVVRGWRCRRRSWF